MVANEKPNTLVWRGIPLGATHPHLARLMTENPSLDVLMGASYTLRFLREILIVPDGR